MPLGWHIGVYKRIEGGSNPLPLADQRGERLAVWQANLAGLRWIMQLREDGDAAILGGDGYPVYFTALARHILPKLDGEPPEANPLWVSGVGDNVSGWLGKTTKYEEVIGRCSPEEWLLIEAWDES